jgi:hypothetical protein
VFPSEKPFSNGQAWSLSRERRPDIVLVVSEGVDSRFLILDAKYRSGRGNILDAMSSAHIYHDSLRLGRRRPDLCLLILPGEQEVPSLEQNLFWRDNRVGALSRFSIAAPGRARVTNMVEEWLSGRI